MLSNSIYPQFENISDPFRKETPCSYWSFTLQKTNEAYDQVKNGDIIDLT